jgi:predicted nucleic acid-binding protein
MATTGGKDIFVDTNVLVYATVMTAPLHSRANSSLQNALQVGSRLWISRQVLREYVMVITRPQTFMQPLSGVAAANQAGTLMSRFQIAEDTSAVTTQWLTLLSQIPMGGKQVYDANIVATMLAHGLTHILTHNVSDFARFGSLITVIAL